MGSQDDQPRYDPEKEVRLAVVMYGGVSLAVYMYGVAEELLHLVRATAADATSQPRLRAPESTETEYRKLALHLGKGRVRTRFVVDILSGTSAGGINGICLAKALANDTSLEDLKRIWLEVGDIGALVNDVAADPKSLLDSGTMHRQLVQALAKMNRKPGDPKRSTLVDELDLWVTATDLDGVPRKIGLADGTVTERGYAVRQHFRHAPGAPDLWPDDDGDALGPANDPFLAWSARATSAFPFAFEPAVLKDFRPADAPRWDADVERWRARNSHYPPGQQFADRAFSDGGILDNKPFSYATESLVSRRASLPVERKLFYVEPDPVDDDGEVHLRWDAVKVAASAKLTIPSAEGIREDVRTVLRRNREIERAREIIARLDATDAGGWIPGPISPQDWAERPLRRTPAKEAWGPAYGVYHRLKVRETVDWLASVILVAGGFDAGSDHAFAAHQFVRAWKERRYEEERSDDRQSENAFLLAYDMPYRLRRLDFLSEKLRGLTPPGDISGADAKAIRTGLGQARGALLRTERDSSVIDAVAALRLTGVTFDELLAAPGDEATLDAASEVLDEGRVEPFDDLAQLLAQRVRTCANEALTFVYEAFAAIDADLAGRLRQSYETFEGYDVILLPLGYGSAVGETNPVDVIRISPDDVGADDRPRLKGMVLAHFGAFLDKGWRLHDMTWGRLDAAERLITTLCPDDDEDRRNLVDAARERILTEAVADMEKYELDHPHPRGWLEGTEDDAGPAEAPTVAAVGRALRVTGGVLSGVVAERAKRSARTDVEKQRDEQTVALARALLGSVLGDEPVRRVLPAVAKLIRRRTYWIAAAVVAAAFALLIWLIAGEQSLGIAILIATFILLAFVGILLLLSDRLIGKVRTGIAGAARRTVLNAAKSADSRD